MDEIKKLYDVLSKRGYYTKSFDDFKVQFQNKAYQDKVYGVVSRDGLYTKSKDEFLAKYSVLPQEPSKKKEVSEVVSPTGGEAGISEAPLAKGITEAVKGPLAKGITEAVKGVFGREDVKEALGRKQREDVVAFLKQEKAKAPTKITGPAPTIPKEGVILPVKSLKKVETTYALPKEKIDQFVAPTFAEVSASQDPLGEIERKESQEKDLQKKADLMAVSNLVRDQIPDFYQAYKASKEPLPDTRTNQLLKERASNYEQATRGLREIKAPDLLTANTLFIDSNILPKIERAAVMYHISKHPSFEKELQAANTSIDNSNLPYALGSAKMGQIMQEFLYSPEVTVFENQEDMNLAPAIERAKEVNLTRNKMWGTAVVANKVSQAFERSDKRRNAIAAFDTPSLRADLNEVATQVLTPEEYKIYDETIRGNEDKYMDVPSFLERFARGGEGVFNGVFNTLSKITGFGKPAEDVVKERWEKEAMYVTADPVGLRNIVGESGRVTGLVAAIAGTGRVVTPTIGAAAAGTGLPATTTASIADAVNVSTAFLGDMLDEGTMKYPDDPIKAYASGIFNTAAFVAMGRSIFPVKKVESVFKNVKPEIDQVVTNLTNGSITREIARRQLNTIVKKGVDVLGAGLAQNVKVSAELTALTAANELLDTALGMDPDKLKQIYPEGVYGDTFKHLFLSNALVSSVAGYGKVKQKNNIARESIYEAASSPNKYTGIIERATVSDPSLNKQELLDNLAFAVETKRLLDQRGVPVERQKDYLVLALGERVAMAEKAKIKDSTLSKEIDNKIKEAQAEKEAILTAPEEVAPEMAQYVMEAPRVAGEPEQISKPIELSIEPTPQVPAAPKQKYRVEYFDPVKGEMTHSYFDSRLEGDTFWGTLTDAQKSKGVKGYFEFTTEPSFGEEAAPQVPAAPTKTAAETAKEQTIETDLLIGGQAAQRRKEGKYTKDGVEFVRNEKGQGLPSEVTGEVRFTNEVSLPFRYKLVEAETLQPSHQDGIRNPNHFIPEAQPKNRNDVGSLMAEDSFASKPRFEELGENTNAYSGAPVVNERGEVIQGNNRSAGLRKGYRAGNKQYKNDLANNAEQFGFTREQVEGMKEPVLVREVAVSDEGAIEIGNYDVKDLETGGKRRLDPIAVTRRMPFDIKGRIAELLFTGEETLNQAIRTNQKRVLELLNPYLNQAQRNTISKEGKLTEAGIKDLEDVVKQFLFDNGDAALPDLFENLSATQKEGLKKSLPYIFSTSPDKSIVPDIQEAILAVNDFKESGAGDFDAWLSQRDMFADGATPRDKYTPLEIEIARTLIESKTQKEIAKKFGDYSDIVRDKPADMFEAAREGKTRAEGIKEIFKTEDYAKPISERGRKTLAGEEKPATEPSPRAIETERAAETAEAAPQDKRAEARQKLKDAFNDLMNLGAVYDPRSQAEKQVKLTKAIINVIKQESIGAIKDLKKFIKENIGFDISDEDAKYLLIESKKPEYAIQEPTAGEVPVQPEARAGKKVEEGVPPAEPPRITEEGETPRQERQKALLNRIVDSSKTPADLKEKIREKGLSYIPATQSEATRLANSILDTVGLDQAVEMASKGEFSGVFGGLNTAVLSQAASRFVNDPVRQAQIFDVLDTSLRSKGQDISYMNEFYAKNPLGVVIYENTRRKNDFDQWSSAKEKKWQEAFDALKAEKEELRKELEELRTIKPTSEGVQRAKGKAEAAKKKRADLIEKYKKGGGLTLTTGGLTKEGIEFVGEVSLTYVQEGIANAEVVIRKVLADLKTIIGKEPSPEVRDEVEQLVRKTVREKKGKPVIDRIRKKLDGLSDKEKEQVIQQSYRKIIESGALEFEDFKNIIADVLGRGPLSEEQSQRLQKLVTTINEVEAKALDAQELRTPEALRDYKLAQKEAAEASKELSTLFNNKPNILKRVSQLIQLRTLGVIALINNPFYNIVNQAFLRFPIGLTNTLIDRAISGAAKVSNVQFNPSTNVLSRRVQAEYFKKLKLGFKESGEQLLTGLNRQDYIQKETYAQSIQPIESMKALYRYAKGKQKMQTAEVIDRALQATGADAEAVARTLNLGDKPFRFGSEGATAADFSEALGLSKGIDYDLFIEFPKAEAYRIYKNQGLTDAEAMQKAEFIEKSIIQEGKRAAFQQDNILNDKLRQLFGEEKSGAGTLIKTLVVSPYVKTPTNVFWSYYNLLHPEVALLQAFVYGGKAYKLREKDPVASKLALREGRYWFGHAVTGMAYVSVISSMVAAGIFTAGSTAEDTKKEREGRSYYGKPGTTNVTKLMAWLRGEDPSKIKGGFTIKNSWFGHIGTLGNAIARREQEMTPAQLKKRGDLMEYFISNLDRDNLFPEALEAMQSGIFSNTSSLINALDSDFGAKRWGLNTINLLTNVVQPATLAQISRAELPYYSTTKADSFMQELKNSMLQRSSVLRTVLGQEPPAKIGIWGDRLEKKDNFMMRWFGISKENPDNFAQPLYDIVKRTNNISYFPPTIKPEIEDQGKKSDLNAKQTMELEMMVGQYRKNLVSPLLNDAVEIGKYGAWSEVEGYFKSEGLSEEEARNKADEIKLDALKNAYDYGFELGKQAFLDAHPEFRNLDYDKTEMKEKAKAMEKLRKQLKQF